MSSCDHLILLRHGRSTANAAGVLAGRSPGVELDDARPEQAQKLVGHRLAGVPVAEIVCSPLVRCEQTVAPLATDRGLTPVVGARAGRGRLRLVDRSARSRTLLKEPLWKIVQAHPSAAVFPGVKVWRGIQARAVAAVREHDARIAEQHGPHGVWLACSHGDVIKSVLADALGPHLDNSSGSWSTRRSISVVHYTATRPFVARINDTGGDLAGLIPPKPKRRRKTTLSPSSDAVVGGSTGDLSRPRTCRARPRWLTLDGVMSRVIHVFRQPERFVAGTVGEPGDRVLLPAGRSRTRARSASCWRNSRSRCSPTGSARCSQEVAPPVRRRSSPEGASSAAISTRSPRRSRRSSGSARWAWAGTPTRGPIVVELLAVTEEEVDESVVLDDTEDGPDALRVFLSPVQARAFADAGRTGRRRRARRPARCARATRPGGSRLHRG